MRRGMKHYIATASQSVVSSGPTGPRYRRSLPGDGRDRTIPLLHRRQSCVEIQMVP